MQADAHKEFLQNCIRDETDAALFIYLFFFLTVPIVFLTEVKAAAVRGDNLWFKSNFQVAQLKVFELKLLAGADL